MQTSRKILAAVTLSALAAAAQAKIVASATYSANFQFSTPTALVPLTPSGGTTKTFAIDSVGMYGLTFSAECSVDAPDGNKDAWIDLDILVDGVAVAPTDNGNNEDAFCGSIGTAGFHNWGRHSITVPVRFTTTGDHKVQVRARLNYGATSGWVSDTALVLF
ncbi:MAG: hypothetical protein U1F53_11340 [Burkholderiaceae bacterium]